MFLIVQMVQASAETRPLDTLSTIHLKGVDNIM